MFGLKKMQRDIEAMNNTILQLKAFVYSLEYMQKNNQKETDQARANLKLELSAIKTKFHDLGEKMDKISQNKTDCSGFADTMGKILLEMEYRKETAKNLNMMLCEVGGKLDKIYQVTDGYEKLTDNMQYILDEHLPVKKLPKLPKKKTATIDLI